MIWLILLLALLLRVISLDQSLWLDEAISALAVRDNDLGQLLVSYLKADFHPPGYLMLLWAWTKLFGYSEIVLRIPSVVFGLLTVWLVYLIGRKIHSVKLGLLAALLLTINPLHIYYSQEARMYSMAALAVTVCFYFFIKLLEKREKYCLLGFWLSLVAVFGSDYLAYLIIPAQLIIVLLNRSVIKTWFFAVGIAAVVWLWWVPMLITQLGVGQAGVSHLPAWKEVVGGFGLKPLVLTYVKFIIGRISHPDNLIYLLMFLPIGSSFGYLLFKAGQQLTRPPVQLLVAWAVVPIMLAWLVSVVIPVYSYFRLLFVVPAFVLLVSWGLIQHRAKSLTSLLVLVVVIQLTASGIYIFNSDFHRENWQGLVKLLGQQDQSTVLFESSGTFAPFDYYTNGSINGWGALERFPAQTTKDVKNLPELLSGQEQVYLAQYLVEISDPQHLVEQELGRIGFEQVKIYNFVGVGFVYQYKRI